MSIQKRKEIGLAAFIYYSATQQIQVIMDDWLLFPSEFSKYPQSIKHKRNMLIYLTFFQIVASVIALLYIIIRRIFLIFLINVISIFLAFVGLRGALEMRAKLLLVHCLFTISLTGGFFVIQILDYFLVNDTRYGESKRLSDTLFLVLFSIPYLYDCFTGIYNYRFLNEISKYRESNRDISTELIEMNEFQFNEDDINRLLSEENKCIICCERNRDCMLYPCGHVLSCLACGELLMKKREGIFNRDKRCPICRMVCERVVLMHQA